MNPLTGVFGEAWRIYRAHVAHLAAIALVVYAVVVAISILLTLLLGWLGFILGVIISLAGAFWLQGALIQAVSDVRDGRRDLSVRETFEAVLPRLNRIVLAGLLLGLAVGVGFLLLVVPGLILMTIWLLVIPAIVLEDRGIGDAFGRSRELVRGHGWQVFGVIVLTVLLFLGLGIVLAVLLSPLEDWLADLIGDLVTNVLIGPYVAAVWTLVYYRLRGEEEPALEPAAPATPAA
ncbi:MAG TPA: YciC family protein [Gaiellaceae bacterium]|nr:YciC family protein [Gaiellaceae bacterium]